MQKKRKKNVTLGLWKKILVNGPRAHLIFKSQGIQYSLRKFKVGNLFSCKIYPNEKFAELAFYL